MGSRRDVGARKSIFDPVHGVITLDAATLELVGHPAFQRLWGIRQTGFVHLVFPGANHTRLEHSLGVYWVARAMAERLRLDAGDAAAIGAGALLHDLGHGPFSHTFDGSMREVLGFAHERISRQWVEAAGDQPVGWNAPRTVREILEAHRIDADLVADLIDPGTRSRTPTLLRSILHGPIDADRIDYLQRDAHYTGVGHGAIDAVRILDTVRDRDGTLAFAEKGRNAIEGFLLGRSLMYSSVYYHKTVRAAEVMAQAALERMPGYPQSVPPLFFGTDADWLWTVGHTPGRSGELVAALLQRRLFKRAFGWRRLTPAEKRSLGRLVERPALRRAAEDRLASAVGAAPGSVLVDLSGLAARESPGDDWGELRIEEGRHLVRPFRTAGPLRSLASRPPSVWATSVYAEERLRSRVESFVRRRGVAVLTD